MAFASPAPDRARVVDTHAHWYPPEWLELLRRQGPRYGVHLREEAGVYRITGVAPVAEFTAAFVDLALRLPVMRRQGVDLQALSLSLPMVHWAPASFGQALASTFNDAASAAHLAHPDRFVGLAQVPLQDPDLAERELVRAIRLPGLRGLYLPTQVAGCELDDPRFQVLYGLCQEADWPIFLHPVLTLARERLSRFFLGNLLGNPYDTGVAAAYLLFGGVLDAFPKLEFSLPHAGGTFPALIGRLSRGALTRPEIAHLRKPPTEYLSRFTYDVIGHHDQVNANVLRLVGAHRMLLGSDYCFDLGLTDPVGEVDKLLFLSQDERADVLGRTACRLLRIEPGG